jgi:hypothetical protein
MRERFGAIVLAVIALAQIARLTLFMLDGTSRQHSILPLSDTIAEHSCLSAYHTAAELVRDGSGAELYEPGAYAGRIGSFRKDLYQYPPPFVLLPRAVGAVAGHDFFRMRALWFPLCLLPLVGALAALARFTARAPVALLAPAVLAAVPTLLGLQYGNFHVPAVALAVLAMLLLHEDDRPGAFPTRAVAGGAILSFVALAKIFPGLLLVVLAARRRWRPVAFTAAWGAVWVLLSAALLGPAPLVAFFDEQLGRLATGHAFPFMADNERVLAANLSVHALVLKLARLAGTEAGTAARVVGWLFAAALVGALAFRRRGGDRLADAQLWLAVLTLGALMSPFAPLPYAAVAPLWLITLLVPEARGWRSHAALAGGWLALSVMAYALPLRAGPPLLALSLLAQLAALGLAGWVVLRAPSPCDHRPAR